MRRLMTEGARHHAIGRETAIEKQKLAKLGARG
jgi:hypothetical protein